MITKRDVYVKFTDIVTSIDAVTLSRSDIVTLSCSDIKCLILLTMTATSRGGNRKNRTGSGGRRMVKHGRGHGRRRRRREGRGSAGRSEGSASPRPPYISRPEVVFTTRWPAGRPAGGGIHCSPSMHLNSTVLTD